MKVLMATAYFDSHRGGIEIVAGRLAHELARRGVDVTWLATAATQPPDGGDLNFAVLPIPAWNVAERRLGFPFPLPGVRGLAAIWRAVASCDAVLMHDSLYPSNVMAMFASRWHRKPAVIVQHIAAVPYSNPVLRLAMQAANMLVARPMLTAADQVVFISEAVAQHFATVRFKVRPRVIFNGVDTELFAVAPPGFDTAPARSRLGLPAEPQLVTFVGRFVEKKGLHIIERLARLRPRLTFALAGWGPIDPAGWRLPNVHVFSQLQGRSLVPLYQASDCLVLPSTGEGFPLVMQEALACGLPVICGSETACADPAAQAFVEGVAITEADLDTTAGAFADRLDRVLGAAALANPAETALGRHAFVGERYSWPAAAAQYLAILQTLVASAQSTAGPRAPAPQRTRA